VYFGLLLVSCVFFLRSCTVSRIDLATVVSVRKAQRIRNYYYYYHHHHHHHHHHPNLRHIIWARCSCALLTLSFNLSPSDTSNVLTGNHSVPSDAGVLFLMHNKNTLRILGFHIFALENRCLELRFTTAINKPGWNTPLTFDISVTIIVLMTAVPRVTLFFSNLADLWTNFTEYGFLQYDR